MKDGSVFQGLLIRKDDKEFVLEIAGIPATFKAEKVERTRELRPVLERYKELRDAAAPADFEQRIALIRWLADRRQIELAFAESELLLAKNPKNIAVEKLVEELRLRVDMIAKGPAEAPKPAPAPSSDPSPLAIPAGVNPTEFPFLTDPQVALIKVFELDLTRDPPPRVLFPRDAAAKMLEEYSSSPLVPASREEKDALLRHDPLELVQLMFRLRARSYYDKVRVLDQPEPMRRFRDDVHKVTLLTGCATSQCHGGREAGRLVFSTFRPTTDTTVYTNYYILNSYRTAAGQPLIDWEKPEQSLVYQLALPREVARFHHPVVLKDGKDQWRPALTGSEDVRAKAMVDWMKSAYRPRPDYSLDYTPYRPFTPPPPPPPVSPTKFTAPSDPVVR